VTWKRALPAAAAAVAAAAAADEGSSVKVQQTVNRKTFSQSHFVGTLYDRMASIEHFIS
jgi:hypothetical protein